MGRGSVGRGFGLGTSLGAASAGVCRETGSASLGLESLGSSATLSSSSSSTGVAPPFPFLDDFIEAFEVGILAESEEGAGSVEGAVEVMMEESRAGSSAVDVGSSGVAVAAAVLDFRFFFAGFVAGRAGRSSATNASSS